jgi:hypothetical protein
VVCFEVELHGRRRWGGSTKLLTSLQTESRKCERERERNREKQTDETERNRERQREKGASDKIYSSKTCPQL